MMSDAFVRNNRASDLQQQNNDQKLTRERKQRKMGKMWRRKRKRRRLIQLKWPCQNLSVEKEEEKKVWEVEAEEAEEEKRKKPKDTE